MNEDNSEQAGEANGRPGGPKLSADYDSYRSLSDPNLVIYVPKHTIPPFRFKAGGWELLQSSVKLDPESEVRIAEQGYLVETPNLTNSSGPIPSDPSEEQILDFSHEQIPSKDISAPQSEACDGKQGANRHDLGITHPPVDIQINPGKDLTEIALRKTASEDDYPTRATPLEIEFALVIARMIERARSDPDEARKIIYDVARYKLREQLLHSPPAESEHAQRALEVAILGVENFSEKHFYIPSPAPQSKPQMPDVASTVREPSAFVDLLPEVRPRFPWHSGHRAGHNLDRWSYPTRAIAIITVLVTLLVGFQHRTNLLLWANNHLKLDWKTETPERSASSATPSMSTADPKPAALRPKDYGVYAISKDALTSLYPVKVTTALMTPSRTILPNGHPKFIVFSRDLVATIGDDIEVRVLAKVGREVSINAATTRPAEATWVIRNISFPFRASPVKDNPEMNELNSEDPALELPAGRYALLLKRQTYEFSVAGDVVDPRHCVERIVGPASISYASCKAP